MTDELGPYARLYMSLRDDDKFVEVYCDDRAFATYCRLLMIAEADWPTSAHLPHGVHRRSLAILERVGLIDLRPGGLFRVSGLDKERERRSAHAKRASNARWNAPSIAPSNAQTMLVQERVRERAKNEHAPLPPEDPADAYWSLTGRYPTDKVLGWLDDLASRFGAEATTRHLALAHIEDAKTSTLLGRTQDRLKAEARALDRKEAAEERERLREKRAIPRELPAWEQEYRAAIEARYAT